MTTMRPHCSLTSLSSPHYLWITSYFPVSPVGWKILLMLSKLKVQSCSPWKVPLSAYSHIPGTARLALHFKLLQLLLSKKSIAIDGFETTSPNHTLKLIQRKFSTQAHGRREIRPLAVKTLMPFTGSRTKWLKQECSQTLFKEVQEINKTKRSYYIEKLLKF